MKIYKFIIPSHTFVPLPSNPSISVKGCLAVVLAETEEQARAIVGKDSEDDVRWLEVARVIVFELDTPRLLAAAQV